MSGFSIGFPPVARADARLLILGSMPGRRSLEQRQYYAQPQNAFWYIMGELYQAGPALPYPERLARLCGQRVALWDVLARCRRPGSLDQHIELASAEVNDFGAFLAAHPDIDRVFFNGQLAGRLFVRRVLGGLPPGRRLRLQALPSTSPAMASLDRQAKLALWRQALGVSEGIATEVAPVRVNDLV